MFESRLLYCRKGNTEEQGNITTKTEDLRKDHRRTYYHIENYYFRSFLKCIHVNIKEIKMEFSYNGMGEWGGCYFQIPEASK